VFVKRLWFAAVVLGVITACLQGTALTGVNSAMAEPRSAASAQEVADALEAQNQFGILLTVVLDAMPQYVADFSWEVGRGVILVTPDGLGPVKDFLTTEASDVPVVLRVADAGVVPYGDQADVELRAIDALRAVGGVALSARYDPYSGRVEATVWSEDVADSTKRAEQIMPQVRGLPLDIAYQDGHDAPRLEASQGGEDYAGCTGAFMATSSAGYGILTAAHCTTKPATYNGSTTGATQTLTTAGGAYDIRFTALSGSSAVNEFRYTASGAISKITSTGTPAAGMTLSKYGQKTGYGTAVVALNPSCISYSNGPTYCGQFSTTQKVTDSGDSGGPWFSAYTGYGIHSGASSTASYFTAIGSVGLWSGIAVKKS